MKTRAAVALEAGKPLEIMEVDLEGPKAGEVLRHLQGLGSHRRASISTGSDPEWRSLLCR